MRNSFFITTLMLCGIMCSPLMLSSAHADTTHADTANAMGQQVDLVLPANLASPDAPFYQEAQVKIGNELIPVREGSLPAGVLVQYQPENKAVIVSDAKNSSEIEKGKALLDVVNAIQASTIAPAAGR